MSTAHSNDQGFVIPLCKLLCAPHNLPMIEFDAEAHEIRDSTLSEGGSDQWRIYMLP